MPGSGQKQTKPSSDVDENKSKGQASETAVHVENLNNAKAMGVRSSRHDCCEQTS